MSIRLPKTAMLLSACLALGLTPPCLAGVRHGHSAQPRTLTPIKHVILIIGENHTFDNLFATYVPPKGQTVWNLLSMGIVTANGTPGPHWALARQWQASDSTVYSPDPPHTRPFVMLPALNTDGAVARPRFASVAQALRREHGLPAGDERLLLSGTTGQPADSVDARFPREFANGPIDVTRYVPYDSYWVSPVHRLFQMRQELDCSRAAMTRANPGGCRADLFPWVEVTVGAGSNGAPRPANYNDQTTHEGPAAMTFYNMARGDVPYLARLAREYTLADNYHQAALGGTGANHVMLGYGTLIYYENPRGLPARPPANQIENPNPQPGTNNWYLQDGYHGGSYTDCADPSQPGVAPVDRYLAGLPYKVFNHGDCRPDAYYLVNNYEPGYHGDGAPAPLGADRFTVPPTRQDNLGLLMSRHHVTWKYYGEGWDGGHLRRHLGRFCRICDPFLYSTQIMTNPALRANNAGLRDLYADIRRGTLPDVSFVKPDELLDGHPASSKVDLLEGFIRKIVDMVRSRPALWKNTAIMITMDEGGGFWDEGYVQPIDFFGDGTRVPLIVVSRYSRGGRVVHTYYDHVSFDKFVEANWQIHQRISAYSRDNLPNPIASPADPYVPLNQPAIGDLIGMFHFNVRH